MIENKELLPCPFCGCKNPYIDYGTQIAVVCPNCGAWVVGGKEPKNNNFPPFKNKTIEMWNTRVESPKLDIAVKALEFYANKNTYKVNVIECVKYYKLIDNDIGQTAKSALQQIKD